MSKFQVRIGYECTECRYPCQWWCEVDKKDPNAPGLEDMKHCPRDGHLLNNGLHGTVEYLGAEDDRL